MKPVRLLLILLAAIAALPVSAAEKHVQWTARIEPADARAGEAAVLVLSGKIDSGWHTYSTTPVKDGPFPTAVELIGGDVEASGKPLQAEPKREYDRNFSTNVELYEGEVTFGLPVKLKPGAKSARARVTYQVCNASSCMPPAKEELTAAVSLAPGEARPERAGALLDIPGVKTDHGSPADAATPKPQPGGATPPAGDDAVRQAQKAGLLPFIWLSLTAGFLALLTPCVFPMVPITVSFFTKQKDAAGGRGIGGAVAYCLGIMGTFTCLGLLLSVVFGASGIQRFAGNPVVNGFLALLFIVLAANLFGVFEIVLPSALINRAHAGTGKGRFVGPLLMGLTFTLTSFTCTVPFVGTLLVTATQGSLVYPAIGMLAFSAAFSSPFFLLALFPQWLSKMPKAGGWLVSVKAFMGFLELAAALKFLSNVDLAFNAKLLTRPVFLAIWAAIMMIAGLYLLGWLRLPHDGAGLKIGSLRRGFGLASAAVGIWCLAGMNGSSLWMLDAFPPPASYGMKGQTGPIAFLEDYEAAVAQAKAEGKPIFINFTGIYCTNCRAMEVNVLPRPEIVAELKKFVPVELYTDGPGPKYEKNQKLEEQLFHTVALPYYVVITPDGKTLGTFPGLGPADKFLAFLQMARDASQQVATR